ncbi:MAG TPA: glycosyltransferase family 4 protein, partial [Nocardioidaceae bacterium]|nr:glycosyltransferase family 4 protein [Nocardioidaceae bacterium]
MTEPPTGLRVLYSFPHVLGRAGIATTAGHQISGLAHEGVAVTLVVAYASEAIPAARTIESLRLWGRRVPHRTLGSVQRAYDHHDARAAALLRSLAGAVDAVHVWPRACLRTLAQARALGIPALREAPSPHTRSAFRTARDAAASFGLELPRSHSHRWDDRVLAREEAEYGAADFLLVPSDYARATFLEQGVPEGKLLLTSYGFDPARFRPAPEPRGQHPGLRAVFIGRGEPNKGLHLALDAWHESGAGRSGGLLDVYGDILPGYRARLAHQLDQPSVRVHGFAADVSAALANADVLVLPTLTEGSALVTYEALGSGCVPLVSDASGAPVEHGRTGLVHQAGVTAELTAHLRRLAERPDDLARLRRACLGDRERWTWQAAASRLAAAYRTAIARQAASEQSKPPGSPLTA